MPEDFPSDLNLALQIAAAGVVCWFAGYGAGAVVRAARRILGKSAR